MSRDVYEFLLYHNSLNSALFFLFSITPIVSNISYIIHLLLCLLLTRKGRNICLRSSVCIFNWFSAYVFLAPKIVPGTKQQLNKYFCEWNNVCFQEGRKEGSE